MKKRFYLRRAGTTIELRQLRYRGLLRRGLEHPHDLLAVATSVEEIRKLASYGGQLDPRRINWNLED